MSIYASQSDVEPLIKFTGDEASDDLFERALLNADSWITARLSNNSIPIWTSRSTLVETEKTVNGETTTVTETVIIIEPQDKPIPTLLNSAACYYAAHDIIRALYNGEDMPTQMDTYKDDAEDLIATYISLMRTELEETVELKKRNPVKHSKGHSYYQRKHRRPRA